MASAERRVISIGGCYVDFNIAGFPIPDGGIQPEQEIMSAGEYDVVAGGSAVNFCRTVAQAGMTPVFFGTVGDDEMAKVLRDNLAQDGVEARLQQVEGASTGICFNMTGVSGEHVMVGSSSANTRLDDAIFDEVERELRGSSYLFLGGIYKLSGILPLLSKLVNLANEQGVSVVVDHARVPIDTPQSSKELVQEVVRKSDIYLPSRDEFLETWQCADVQEGLRQLQQSAPQLKVAVKNGADAVIVSADGEISEVQPPQVEKVVDVTGAGDMFNSILMAEFSRSGDFLEAVKKGCEAASKKVSGN